jgi:hypothetical protein
MQVWAKIPPPACSRWHPLWAGRTRVLGLWHLSRSGGSHRAYCFHSSPLRLCMIPVAFCVPIVGYCGCSWPQAALSKYARVRLLSVHPVDSGVVPRHMWIFNWLCVLYWQILGKQVVSSDLVDLCCCEIVPCENERACKAQGEKCAVCGNVRSAS